MPAPTAADSVLEASAVGMVLVTDDDVLEASQVGMVLEPEPRPRPRQELRLPPGLVKRDALARIEAAKVDSPAQRKPTPCVPAPARLDIDAPPARPAPAREAPRLPDTVAFDAEESRKNWYGAPRAERRWDLVETVESAPAPDPGPAVRRFTPRKNPYRAPESQWDARIEDITRPRPRVVMWTAISAGISALVCCVAFLVAASDEPALTETAASEPIIIRYDEGLLEPATEIAAAAVADDHVGDRHSHALALALRGRTNMLAGRTKLALSQFHEALEYNAQNRLALAQLGEWHLERGRAAKAAEYLRRAVRVEPRDAKAQFLLGRAYDQLGRPQKATLHYSAAQKQGYRGTL